MPRIFRRLQDSRVAIFGTDGTPFDQDGLVFSDEPGDDILIQRNGEEIETFTWQEIMDDAGAPAGVDKAATLTYLNDQLDPVQVSADFANSDIATNFNLSTSFNPPILLPIAAVEVKPSPLYEIVDDFTIRTLFFGESVFSVNIHFRADTPRVAPRIRLISDPNGLSGGPNVFGSVGASGYIRDTNGHTESSCHIAGIPRGHGQQAEFGVAVSRDPGGPTGAFTLASNQTSHFSVCRLR